MKVQLTEKSYVVVENGKLHNEDGPAWVHEDGSKEYYYEGKLHRDEGPAREMANGIKEIWFNGVYQGKIDTNGTYWPAR